MDDHESDHDFLIEPTESGKRWTVECSCGWVCWPPTRATYREAVKSAIYHKRREVYGVEAARRGWDRPVVGDDRASTTVGDRKSRVG